jgi:hypothetical protein
MAQVRDAGIDFYWDPRAKRWKVQVRGEGGHRVVTGEVETTKPLDHAAMHMIMSAIREEMLSWIF